MNSDQLESEPASKILMLGKILGCHWGLKCYSYYSLHLSFSNAATKANKGKEAKQTKWEAVSW